MQTPGIGLLPGPIHPVSQANWRGEVAEWLKALPC